ncbi:MAG TPA: hypothetical protein VMB80_11765 [Candidatus Acidoferrum sp.]|nr:hypothetical protein [Candidatus Acidoferrum sp.]
MNTKRRRHGSHAKIVTPWFDARSRPMAFEISTTLRRPSFTGDGKIPAGSPPEQGAAKKRLHQTLAAGAALFVAPLRGAHYFAISRLCVAVLLAGGATSTVLAGEAAGDDLVPAQIFEKVQATYASVSSYSDEGRVVTALDDKTIVNFTIFTTRLARTNCYLIEWNQTGESSCNTRNSCGQGVWSFGEGDFLQAGCGVQPQGSREFALANAVAFCSGATATIPWLFFNAQEGDREKLVDDWGSSAKRESDENLGNITCYVFTRESQGQTNTLWIGKQDFLIHQVRRAIGAEAVQAAAAKALIGPELVPTMHGFALTETHINIVLNRPFSRSDFVPSFPLF